MNRLEAWSPLWCAGHLAVTSVCRGCKHSHITGAVLPVDGGMTAAVVIPTLERMWFQMRLRIAYVFR